MLAYQSYNVKSPLNGEAARWVDENEDSLPLDKISMLVEERDSDAKPAETRPMTNAAPAITQIATDVATQPERIRTECPECECRMLVPASVGGKRIRCKQCRNVFRVS